MQPIDFPDPATADEDGIVAIGGNLLPETLLAAYRKGIFPWPVPGYPKKFPYLTWFSPDPRGILEFEDLHIPRSLKKAINRSDYTYSIDKNFKNVIGACKNVPRQEKGTWITPDIVEAYIQFHQVGHAHSVEVWDGPDLVAGLYGVDAFGVFAGESMFTLVDDGSKLALMYFIEHLKARGATWIDIQMVTPHMEAMGGKLIRRDAFLTRLAQTQALDLRLFDR
ncbi:MAG TPA: leucyl/phenylalanyl-tRNA--protein transferase [Oligoflexia bacterium]|nr:leucyl/phenylalanyl-tRNA--protein transferase [Oligoflexia bacterium]